MTNFLKIDDLVRITQLSRSSVYRLIGYGQFPEPTKIGRASVWGSNQIQEWMNDKLEMGDTK